MSRAHRKRALLIGLLGVVVTLVVTALDLSGNLSWLEERLYDSRAYRCQRFGMVAPTKTLLHLDIDDPAQTAIGKWPWPRETVAKIVDELHDAGAKVLFMDILFTDVDRDAQGNTRTEGDRILAESIARFGHVLTPVSLPLLEHSPTLLHQRMVAEMSHDLELEPAQFLERMAQRAENDQGLAAEAPKIKQLAAENFNFVRQEAMYNRIAAMLDQQNADFPTIKNALLPKLDPLITSSTLIDLLREQYDHVLRDREMRRFKVPIPRNLPVGISDGSHEFVPLPVIAHAAAYSGFVDPLTVGDQRIRSVALAAESRGFMYPHVGLALACAMLDVDIQNVVFSADRVTIRRKNGSHIDIPVRTAANDQGNPVALVMEVPWFGSTDWRTMYDYPRYQNIVQHESVTLVTEVMRQRNIIKSNELQLRTATKRLSELISPDDVKTVDQKEPAALEQLVAERLAQSKEYLDAMKDAKASDLKEDDRILLKSLPPTMKQVSDALARTKEARPVLQDALEKLRKAVEGRAVLMGFTATGAVDTYSTPLHDRCPGVVALGAIYNGIMTGRMFETTPHRWETISTLGLGLATTALVALAAPVPAMFLTGFLALMYFLINGFVLYDFGHMISGAAGPTVAMAGAYLLPAVARSYAEAREKAQIKKRFQRYVDPKLVDYSSENPDKVKFDGQIQEMSVVFTDLEGFTTLSEALKEKTVPMLSEYMGEMVPIIRANNGYVNKFLGDGIMFFFNAPVGPDPNHPTNAVKAIMGMQHAMIAFNDRLRAQGLPTLNMRAGVVTGEMVVGDAGPLDASDYTVLGDNVNLASRLEGANKATGTNTMIHWRTRELLGEEFICRPIGRLQVKGKTEGVMTFEPLGPAGLITEQQRKMAEMSRKIVDAYIAGKFDECIAAVAEMEKELGESKFTKLYHQEAQQRKEEFAWKDVAEFNGVITLHDK